MFRAKGRLGENAAEGLDFGTQGQSRGAHYPAPSRRADAEPGCGSTWSPAAGLLRIQSRRPLLAAQGLAGQSAEGREGRGPAREEGALGWREGEPREKLGGCLWWEQGRKGSTEEETET